MSRMSLSAVTVGAPPLPPRQLIYGVGGVGKTTFATSSPRALLLPIAGEDGIGLLPVAAFPTAETWADVMAAFREVYDAAHDYDVLALDSLDRLEALVWAETCRRYGKSDIEAFGYGKGFLLALDVWAELLKGLDAIRRKRLMQVVLIAHAEIRRFDDPNADPYDRYQPKLHKGASALVVEWADLVGFCHYETLVKRSDAGFNKSVARGIGSGRRVLGVEERPSYIAKNRYQLPATLPLEWAAVQQAIAASAARLRPATSVAATIPAPAPEAADASVPVPTAA